MYTIKFYKTVILCLLNNCGVPHFNILSENLKYFMMTNLAI